MKKTTYISGLTLRYSCEAIDRTGVDQANAQDRAAVLRDLHALDYSDVELAQSGYDERGNWHPESGVPLEAVQAAQQAAEVVDFRAMCNCGRWVIWYIIGAAVVVGAVFAAVCQ